MVRYDRRTTCAQHGKTDGELTRMLSFRSTTGQLAHGDFENHQQEDIVLKTPGRHKNMVLGVTKYRLHCK